MARRLLGADNAATVFNTQQVEEEPVRQVQYIQKYMRAYAQTQHSPHLHNMPLCHIETKVACK